MRRFFLLALGVLTIIFCLVVGVALETSMGARLIFLVKQGETDRIIDKALSMSGSAVAKKVVQAVGGNLETSGMPVYRLTLSPRDVSEFSKYASESMKKGEKIDSLNRWRKASIEYQGQTHDIEVKLHGTANDHYRYRKKSFSIKSTEKINGLVRFGLLNNPSIDNVFLYEMLQIFGILDAKSELVVLYINNELFGLYHLEERLNKELLEKNGLATSVVLKTKPDLANFHSSGHQTTYDFSTLNVETSTFSDQISEINLGDQKSNLFPDYSAARASVAVEALQRLFDAVEEKNTHEIFQLIDVDTFAKSEAFRFITGNVHYILGDNRRFVYDYSTGKFVFLYPRPESGIVGLLKVPGDVGRFESQFFQLKYLRGTQSPMLMAKLSTIPEFRARRNYYLRKFLQKSEILLSRYEELTSKYRMMVYADEAAYFDGDLAEKIESFRRRREVFASNLQLLQEYVDYGRGFVNIELLSDQINVSVAVDSNTPVIVDEMSIVTVKPSLDDEQNQTQYYDLTPEFADSTMVNKIDVNQFQSVGTKTHTIKGDFSGKWISSASISLRNELSGADIPKDKISVVVRDNRSFENVLNGQDAINFVKMLDGIRLEHGTLIMEEGTYSLNRSLDFEGLVGLRMEPGVRLLLGKNISIAGISNITAIGTSLNPIHIEAIDEHPFGSVIVDGNGVDSCHIENLTLQNGSEALVNGLYSSAAFYISRCDSFISDTKIINNRSEDGLNIKNANASIVSSVFSGNYGDQVDLDSVTGFVRNSAFFDPGSVNGDGLDISDSNMIVENNKFSGFSDKGISVGEASFALVIRNQVSDNDMGVAVKDGSSSFFYDNNLKNNRLDITSYMKKPFFEEPVIWFLNQASSENITLDTKSGAVRTHRLPKTLLDIINLPNVSEATFDQILSMRSPKD